MREFVLGLMFSKDLKQVALIKKNRPEWQAGKLNGIGGALKKEESFLEAMIREFKEETGVETKKNDWNQIACLTDTIAMVKVHCLCAVGDLTKIETCTDEEIFTALIDQLPLLDKNSMVGNLPWIIQFAMDDLVNPSPMFAEVSYHGYVQGTKEPVTWT